MSKNKTIKYQVQGELMQKLAIGESRHKAKLESEDGKSDKIHSWSSYNNYDKPITELSRKLSSFSVESVR